MKYREQSDIRIKVEGEMMKLTLKWFTLQEHKLTSCWAIGPDFWIYCETLEQALISPSCWAIGVVLHGVDRQSHEQILQRVEGYGDKNLPDDQNLHCVWRCFKFAIIMVILWLCREREEEELWGIFVWASFWKAFFFFNSNRCRHSINIGPKMGQLPAYRNI